MSKSKNKGGKEKEKQPGTVKKRQPTDYQKGVQAEKGMSKRQKRNRGQGPGSVS